MIDEEAVLLLVW